MERSRRATALVGVYPPISIFSSATPRDHNTPASTSLDSPPLNKRDRPESPRQPGLTSPRLRWVVTVPRSTSPRTRVHGVLLVLDRNRRFGWQSNFFYLLDPVYGPDVLFHFYSLFSYLFFSLERFSSIKIKLEIREVVLKDEC